MKKLLFFLLFLFFFTNIFIRTQGTYYYVIIIYLIFLFYKFRHLTHIPTVVGTIPSSCPFGRFVSTIPEHFGVPSIPVN